MQKRRTRWLVGGAVLCAVGAGTLLLIPREQLLLTKAHKTVLTSEQLGFERSVWRSAQEQLVLRGMDNTDHFGVFTRNINTGKETPLEPFNTRSATVLKMQRMSPRIQRIFNAPSRIIDQFALPSVHAFSPDGKWLLWGDKTSCRVIALDGSTDVSTHPASASVKLVTPKYGRSTQYWLRDSRHWVEVVWDNQFYVHGVVIHDLDAPQTSVTKTFTGRGDRWPSGVTPDNHLLSYEPIATWFAPDSPPVTSSFTFYDAPFDDPQPLTRKITLPLPPGTAVNSVEMSPDGTRLLWSLRTGARVPGPPWLHALCVRMGMKPRVQYGLWISRRDGSDLREIGHTLPKPTELSGTPQQQKISQAFAKYYTGDISRVQWLPDSKHVLFAVRNDTYTVDVE